MAKKRKTKDDRPDRVAERVSVAQQKDATRDPSTPHSEIAAELLAFAGRLKSNVTEALTFCDDVVVKRIGWGATKNTETHFFNRAIKTSRELRQRRVEFDGLDARCASADPSRPMIDDLAEAGLRKAIEIVAPDLADIAAKSRRPMTDADRDRLCNESQGCRTLLGMLLDVAEWIEDEAIATRGGTVPGRERTQTTSSQPPLPPVIEAALLEAEKASREFIDQAAQGMLGLEPRRNEAVLALLKRLGPEFSQIERASKKVVRIQKMFTDKHREIAEKQGHDRFLRFLETNERMSRRLADRRKLSGQLVAGMIERLTSRLSLTDEAANRASAVERTLEDVLGRLQSDQSLLEQRAGEAASERLAHAATAGQLPAWDKLGEQTEGGKHGFSKLQMLLMAFVERRGKAKSFGEATRKQLKSRLSEMFAKQKLRRLSDRQLEKLLEEAKRLKLVYKRDRPPKTSRRVGDEFELCSAAIKKYRRHLVRT